MEISLVRYKKDLQSDWNKFVHNSKNALFFFDRNFMDYHSDRFVDHSLIFLKKNKIIALFPATEHGLEIISHAGLTFGSLLLSFDAKTIDILEIFEKIKNYYRGLSFENIVYKSIPYIFHQYPSQEDLYALFRHEGKITRRDVSSVIDLNNPIPINNNKKRLNKRCADYNVLIKETTDLKEYWKVLTIVLEKFNTKPTHNLFEILSLKEHFPNNIKFFEARKSNELLAGVLIFDFGNVIHAQYMAATQNGRKIGALDFINSFLLEKYKYRKYYSFGISTEKNGLYLNTGLIQQKENMGARAVTLDVYTIKL
ncbi:GNAT family N-acetyltransferase [Kaistella polysaccharea]|uniref:GNAT family N-acetyltransferase n=1 Tax=Kaistella polysaccharea TaxID=2878534 RepID=UPI001CF1D308|nr:GNAT family N-acetyltransferase [Kaistella polysaccharea]